MRSCANQIISKQRDHVSKADTASKPEEPEYLNKYSPAYAALLQYSMELCESMIEARWKWAFDCRWLMSDATRR
jgi:hypothetical protein